MGPATTGQLRGLPFAINQWEKLVWDRQNVVTLEAWSSLPLERGDHLNG